MVIRQLHYIGKILLIKNTWLVRMTLPVVNMKMVSGFGGNTTLIAYYGDPSTQ